MPDGKNNYSFELPKLKTKQSKDKLLVFLFLHGGGYSFLHGDIHSMYSGMMTSRL